MTTKPLSRAFNVAVLHITGRILPCGFDVSADAPRTLEELTTHHAITGRICVQDGASERVFVCPEVTHAFRAWRNSKHLVARLLFTPAGILKAITMQKADIRAIYDGSQADVFCALVGASG